MTRPFRFGVFASHAATAAAWRESAHRAEELGYDVFLVGDHLGPQFAPVPALLAAADATTHLRVGSYVFANDYRNPLMLAKEVTTLDVLTGGRLEIGLGAGWMRSDYEMLGIPYDPPAVRIARFMEAAILLKRLLSEEAVTHEGAHYRVKTALLPRPLQRPRPPLVIGGGGRTVLRFAAREADIVSLLPQADADGLPRSGSLTSETLEQRVDHIRHAAGTRFASLELSVIVFDAALSASGGSRARSIPERFRGVVDNLHESPYFLYGERERLVDRLRAQRDRLGISYIALPETAMEAFGPIVAELART